MATKTSLPPALSNTMHTAGIFADTAFDGVEIGTLILLIDRAKNLPNRRSMGKQDPYCAARLGKEAKKTPTDRRGGQTPRWGSELRFNVLESPDYYNLKLSLFNDDKKTELIGETWLNLESIITPGGGQSDFWQPLNFKGKYAGEIRLELKYLDTRPAPPTNASSNGNVESLANNPDSHSSTPAGPRQPAVKRRPLPADPTRSSPASRVPMPPDFSRMTPGHPNGPREIGSHPHSSVPQENPDDVFRSYQNSDVSSARGGFHEAKNFASVEQDHMYIATDAYTDPHAQDARMDSNYPHNWSSSRESPHTSNLPSQHWRQHSQPGDLQHYSHPSQDNVQDHYSSFDDPHQPEPSHAVLAHSGLPGPVHHGYGSDARPRSSYGHGQISHDSQEPYQIAEMQHHPHQIMPAQSTRSYRNDPPQQYEGNYQDHQDSPSARRLTYAPGMDAGLPPAPPAHRNSMSTISYRDEERLQGNTRFAGGASTSIPQHLGQSRSMQAFPSSYQQPYEAQSSSASTSDLRRSAQQSQASPAMFHRHHSDQSPLAPAPGALHEHRHSYPNAHMQGPPHPSPQTNCQYTPTRASAASYASVGRTRHIGQSVQQVQTAQVSPTRHDPQAPYYTSSYQGQPHHPRARSPRDQSQPTSQRAGSPDPRESQTSRRSFPTRKSVSPRPTPDRNSDISDSQIGQVPFSPDSYNTLNPGAGGSTGPDSVIRSSAGRLSTSSANEEVETGPIVTPDGRTIDPSDHLPVHSWAPEPEPRGPPRREPAPRERDRVAGARELGSYSAPATSRTRVTVSNLRSSPAASAHPHASNAFNQRPSPSPHHSPATSIGHQSPAAMDSGTNSPGVASYSPTGRNRLQKRGHQTSASNSPLSQQQNTGPLRERENVGGYPSGGFYGHQGPPLPAKLPLENPNPLSGETRALGEEMMRIDISGTRTRRGRLSRS